MRQFYLVNEVGTTFIFNFRNQAFISEIDNIGYERENTYLTFENSFKKVDEKVPQTEINFTVVFLAGYRGYASFLEFIRQSKELRLFYRWADQVKYMNVAFKGITKTELQSGAIQSTLTLEKLSLWLNKINYSIKVNRNEQGKVFPFKYPFVYSSSYNGEITVVNNGEYKAALYVCIEGAVNNPEVEVTRDGELVSKLRLMVTSENCIIEVNAEKTDQYMRMTENGMVRNIYGNQDFTCDNFLFLDSGTYRIKFKPGVNSVTTCKISVLEEYGGH